MSDEYKTMKEIGKPYRATSFQVGKVLKALGYRNEEGKPTFRAFDEGLVAKRFVDDRPGIYGWAWHSVKTTAILEAAGWKKVEDEPTA